MNNNNLINSYKSNYNSLTNKASKSSLISFDASKHIKTVTNFGKKTQKTITSTVKGTTKKLHNIVNSKIGNSILNFSIIGLFVLVISILVFFYNKLQSTLKTSLYYLIISLIALFGSMYGTKLLFSDSLFGQLVSLLLVGVFAGFLVLFSENMLSYFKSIKINSPWIIKGNKNGKNSMNIPQEPENPDTVILYRSDNQDGGIEFSYSFWIIIQDYSYNDKEEKHIFHKGDSEAKNTFCPKIVLKRDTNAMVFKFNLINNTDSPDIVIDNIPINKWFHISLILKQTLVEIYVNGGLKKSVELETIPRQNFHDLWVNLFGGFDGFLSKFQYHRRAIRFDEVESMVSDGPSTDSCSVSGAKPPYLDNEWWLDR